MFLTFCSYNIAKQKDLFQGESPTFNCGLDGQKFQWNKNAKSLYCQSTNGVKDCSSDNNVQIEIIFKHGCHSICFRHISYSVI